MENNTNPHKSSAKSSNLFFTIAVILFILILGYFFMRGSNVITKEPSNPEKADSLYCFSSKIAYPFIEYDNSDEKELKINIIFENDKINSISLAYALEYGNTDAVRDSKNINHSAVQLKLQEDGIASNEINLHFSEIDRLLKMSLYSEKENISNALYKYFLLEDLSNDDYSKASIKNIYEKKGLTCN